MDALRAATPRVVVVETLSSKTSLGRRRVVVEDDEDAVETREAAARRNMRAHRQNRFGSARLARDGDKVELVELAGVASSFKASVGSKL